MQNESRETSRVQLIGRQRELQDIEATLPRKNQLVIVVGDKVDIH